MLTEYGKVLRKLRIDNGELLNDMADKLEVSTALLSYIENGKREIPLDFTSKLVKTYKITSDALKLLEQTELELKKGVSINLEQYENINHKEIAVLFARRFKELDDGQIEKLRKFFVEDLDD